VSRAQELEASQGAIIFVRGVRWSWKREPIWCADEAKRVYQVPEYGLTRAKLEQMIGGVPTPWCPKSRRRVSHAASRQ